MKLQLHSILVAIVGVSLFTLGCEKPVAQPTGTTPQSATQDTVPSDNNESTNSEPNKKSEPEEQASPVAIKQSSFNFNTSSGSVSRVPGRDVSAAIEQITAAILESTQIGPTLVVWLFDQSASASSMISGSHQSISQFYEGLGSEGASSSQLKTAVVAFGSQVKFLVDEPVNDTAAVEKALASFEQDGSGRESTFAAIKAALDKYKSYQTTKGHQLMFVIVTDEAGDDAHLVDELTSTTKSASIPVYVVGVPAPFGRPAGLRPLDSDKTITQGPESRYSERIQLAFWGDPYGMELIDSGFGSFHLERLCDASGGRFVCLRPGATGIRFQSSFGSSWPSASAGSFESRVMRRYAPDYISEADYKELLSSNAACKALHQAAQLGPSGTLNFPPVDFVKRSEAQLVNDLSDAQKIAAKLQPVVNKLYNALKSGEADRDKLTSPRWQAGFDLAYGRVLTAKARIDGYNQMLASLKRGKEFQNESSDRWVLTSVDPKDMTEAGSALKKMAERARTYLKRVVDEHAGTPWAMIAEKELNPKVGYSSSFSEVMTKDQFNIGWKWTERGPN